MAETLTTIILTPALTDLVALLADEATRHSDDVKIAVCPQIDDFAKERNQILQQSKSDWTFFIDSDEWVPQKLWTEIRQAISANEVDALVFKRHDSFLGRRLNYGEVGAVRLLRCARTKLGKGGWQRRVHEIWAVKSENQLELDTPLEHHPHPTLSEFLAKLHRYASLEPIARDPYSKERIIFELATYPIAKFIHNYLLRTGWRDGWPGLVHAGLMSYYSLITRVYLYEAHYTKRP